MVESHIPGRNPQNQSEYEVACSARRRALLARMAPTAKRLISIASYAILFRQRLRSDSTCMRTRRGNFERGRIAMAVVFEGFSISVGWQSLSWTAATAPSVRNSESDELIIEDGIAGRGALYTAATQPAKLKSRT